MEIPLRNPESVSKPLVGGGGGHLGPLFVLFGAALLLSCNNPASSPDPTLSRRSAHAVAVLNDELYLIGGNDGTNQLNDVWKSTDGRSWTRVLTHTPSPPSTQFSRRSAHAVAVLNDELYLIGGNDGTNQLNDVWKSTDGRSWTRVLTDTDSPPSTQFSRRFGHEAVVLNDELYLIGGLGGTNALNDVWKSTDGRSWTRVLTDTDSPPSTQFPGRYRHEAVVLGNAIYLIGGFGNDLLNDVWKSTDGQSWTRVLTDTKSPPSTQFSRRFGHEAVVLGNALYLIGGLDGRNRLNDVWKSTDGKSWTREDTPSPPSTQFSRRNSHAAVALNNALYLIGGYDGTNLLNDVWKSSDAGASWNRIH